MKEGFFMFEKEENKDSNSNKKKRRITEIGIAVLILLALIVIKLAAGKNGNPGVTNTGNTIFDAYQIEIPDFDGNNSVITVHILYSSFRSG